MAPLTPEPTSPLYSTDIAQTPLPEVLVKIHRYRAPGRLDCRRGEERKRIYLERGAIIFATTNLLQESLGDTLLREVSKAIVVDSAQTAADAIARLRERGAGRGAFADGLAVSPAAPGS